MCVVLVTSQSAIANTDADVIERPTPAAAAESTPAVPRSSYWCAALLSTPPVRNLKRHELLHAIGRPKALLDGALAPTRPRGLLRRFIAWLNDFDEFHLGDLNFEIKDTATYAPGKDERTFVRKVTARLREIEREVSMLPVTAMPMLNALRGREAIREYLLSLESAARRLEAEHAAQIAAELDPPAAPGTDAERRVGLFWKDLGRGLFYTGVSGLAAYAALRGWQLDNMPVFLLSAGTGISFGARGLQKAFGPLLISFNTYVDEVDRQEIEVRRREYEVQVQRAHEQLKHIDAMLLALDADPATQRNVFVYHGYMVELPIRNTPTLSRQNRITADAIIKGERLPDAYDPVLNRWVVVDQLFQFDEFGEPTLMTFMREQDSYGKSLVYDGWINNSAFMP